LGEHWKTSRREERAGNKLKRERSEGGRQEEETKTS
jgi:hypothetical protein